jgi:L-threonylcarbamoyladenylate synthase
MTKIIPFSNDNAVEIATVMLKSGGVIAFPTDTVYGVACDLWNSEAIEKVFAIKERTKDKPLPILVGHQDQMIQVAEMAQISATTIALMNHFWPGAMTVIVPKNHSIPENLSPFDTVGVRMPDHALLLTLLRSTGPLAVTSANKSGQVNPTTAADVAKQLGGEIDLILDGGKTDSEIPSTVVASTPEGYQILRQGAITEKAIQAALT